VGQDLNQQVGWLKRSETIIVPECACLGIEISRPIFGIGTKPDPAAKRGIGPVLRSRPLNLPRRKPGSIAPTHEPITVGKVLESLAKSEEVEAWIPAFAGTARAEIVNFSTRSGYLPSLCAQPIQRVTASKSGPLVSRWQVD
jgi:hypothetical protein